MRRWGFSDALAFAVAMTVRDMSREKEKRLIKTQKFYQECYERIANDSEQAFNIVSKVVKKASRRYIPNEIASGSTYLALYAFALVIPSDLIGCFNLIFYSSAEDAVYKALGVE